MGMKKDKLRRLFEDKNIGGVPEMSGYNFNQELDEKGRVLGRGPERFYPSLLTILMVLNILLLAMYLGYQFRQIILQSPLLIFIGHISAFIVLVIFLIATFIYWIVSGTKEPMLYVYSRLMFGTEVFQSVCSLIPISFIISVILLKALKKMYVSKKAAVVLLFVNCAIALILITFISETLFHNSWRFR